MLILSGLPKAEYACGYFTEMGIGCRRDPLEANVWYVKAADHGDERDWRVLLFQVQSATLYLEKLHYIFFMLACNLSILMNIFLFFHTFLPFFLVTAMCSSGYA